MSFVETIRGSLLWPMLRKEFIQMRRDRLTFAMVVGIPILELVLFGYAVRTEVKNLPTVVLDESRSSESRGLITTLEQTQYMRIVGAVGSREELRSAIESGRALAAIVIPPQFHIDIKRGRTAQAQVIVDAADPLASGAAISGAALAATISAARLAPPPAGRAPPLDVRVRPLYNPALRSAVYIVPGLIAVLLSITLLLVTGISIVRERELGTFEQLVVTPISKTSIILGKLIPFVVVGYIQMTSVLIFGKLLFNVPIRGSLMLLYVLTMGYIVANLAIGLLISALVRTQIQAMQLSVFFLLPNMLLSGFMFPREAMPVIAQWLGLTLPATYYLRILRGILLKGVGFEYLWKDTLVLASMSLLFIFFSVTRFRKTVQ
ncbi:MAG TPA: ABC transporter permease [Gemmatimonadaceae bacterium]